MKKGNYFTCIVNDGSISLTAAASDSILTTQLGSASIGVNPGFTFKAKTYAVMQDTADITSLAFPVTSTPTIGLRAE